MENKNLEALQEIAVKILKLNQNSSAEELQEMTRKLYENLTVQLYLQNNAAENKENLQEELPKKAAEQEPVPVEQPENRENLAEPLIEKIKDIVAQMPEETQQMDELLEEIIPQKKSVINDLEEFAANYQQTPVFERKDSEASESKPKKEKEQPEKPEKIKDSARQKSLNDKLTKNIQIGLNDRISLTKHLFGDNANDYNRVVSQVTTLSSYKEAQEFILHQVKADYNWEGKEVYLERFLMLIEKRFD
jgi:hypothetical protein